MEGREGREGRDAAVATVPAMRLLILFLLLLLLLLLLKTSSEKRIANATLVVMRASKVKLAVADAVAVTDAVADAVAVAVARAIAAAEVTAMRTETPVSKSKPRVAQLDDASMEEVVCGPEGRSRGLVGCSFAVSEGHGSWWHGGIGATGASEPRLPPLST